MSWRHTDALGGLLVVALGVVVLAGALTTPDVPFGVVGPAVLPSIFGGLILISGIWLMTASRTALSTAALEALDVRPLALSALAIALYFATFVPLGFVVSSIGFFVAMARILGSRAMVRDVLAGAGFVTALSLLFQSLLTVELPRGVLPF